MPAAAVTASHNCTAARGLYLLIHLIQLAIKIGMMMQDGQRSQPSQSPKLQQHIPSI